MPQLLDSGVASIEESNDPGTRNNKLQRTFRIEEDSDSVKSGGPSCLGPVLQTLQTIPSQSPPDSAHNNNTGNTGSSFWTGAAVQADKNRLMRVSNSLVETCEPLVQLGERAVSTSPTRSSGPPRTAAAANFATNVPGLQPTGTNRCQMASGWL